MIQSLYKYMPFRPSFFENFLIRATGRQSLNDPLEVSPSVEYFSDLCIQTGHKRFGETKKQIEAYLVNQHWSSTWKHLGISEYFENGVISLTETSDNLLMWSHYANEHKGVVVEFDPNNEFFTNNYKEEQRPYYGKINRVLYRKQRLKEFNSFVEPYFHKSDEWLYEKEHRFLVSLFRADKKLILKKDLQSLSDKGMLTGCVTKEFSGGLLELLSCDFEGSLPVNPEIMFMYRVPEDAIKSVIFGARMNNDDIEALNRVIDQNPKMGTVQKYLAMLDDREYKVNITRL